MIPAKIFVFVFFTMMKRPMCMKSLIRYIYSTTKKLTLLNNRPPYMLIRKVQFTSSHVLPHISANYSKLTTMEKFS